MDAVVLKKKGYSLGDTLGEGSYGKVKAAYSHRLKCKVAIKIIDKKKISQNVLEKFLPREMEALMRLHHPSIIETYEIFETSSGKVYIVMELGEKGSLLNYLTNQGAMEESTACSKFQQLASAIKHCHDLDFAHRDLKCDNILLDNDLNLKLSDFGFSKPLTRDGNGKTILSTTFCGSLAYSAPELLEHIPCDPRISDMWSLGIILYAMLFASQPFDSSNVREMLQVQKQQKIPFIKSKNLSAECKNLIVYLLHPDVSQRLCIDEVLRHPWLQTPKLMYCLRAAGGGDPKACGKKNLRNNRMANPIVRKCKEWRRRSEPLKDTFL
ncbi:PREDICTED: testis-specific serine/threonine-protein kinase 2-like [Pseudopodoces humilis]|uniref:testis-specific serine/threonine-protein kinase 2-like n=1 Tax=Pseudopodoces humilis TaxID=181119 RepID=UPI000395B8C9|nr:PREDICTED: testis-specific serine/threonine-protein kinase 2-like [Pseudopodoces humilis]XP_023781621.1 testis-specific serine/threonine-protein kinase 2-like [Cyanistes caeruleus]